MIQIPKQIVAVVKNLVTRDFFIKTTYAAKGRAFSFPTNLAYENPIDAVHHLVSANCPLKFETRDG